MLPKQWYGLVGTIVSLCGESPILYYSQAANRRKGR